jgi:hypothetical protein
MFVYLAGKTSDRLSVTQAAFFFAAAHADVTRRGATRSELIAEHSETFGGSVRNTYRQLLEPSRSYPKALGWLTTEPNPDDDREQFLRLTDKGRRVIQRTMELIRS